MVLILQFFICKEHLEDTRQLKSLILFQNPDWPILLEPIIELYLNKQTSGAKQVEPSLLSWRLYFIFILFIFLFIELL